MVRQEKTQLGEPMLDACIGCLGTPTESARLSQDDKIRQAMERLVEFYSLLEDPVGAAKFLELRNEYLIKK